MKKKNPFMFIIYGIMLLACVALIYFSYTKSKEKKEKYDLEMQQVMAQKIADFADSNTEKETTAKIVEKEPSEPETIKLFDADDHSLTTGETESESPEKSQPETEKVTGESKKNDGADTAESEPETAEETEAAVQYAGVYRVSSDSAVTVYDSESGENYVSELAPKVIVLALDASSESMLEVDFYGRTGWISKDSVKQVGDSYAAENLGDKIYISSGDDECKVYAEAGNDKEEVSTLGYGNEFQLLDTTDGWGKIAYDGEKEGWIDLKNASVYLPDSFYYVYTTTTSTINVRKSSDSSSAVVTSANRGTFYKIKEFANGWGKISVSGTEGWVKLQYMIPCMSENEEINLPALPEPVSTSSGNDYYESYSYSSGGGGGSKGGSKSGGSLSWK